MAACSSTDPLFTPRDGSAPGTGGTVSSTGGTAGHNVGSGGTVIEEGMGGAPYPGTGGTTPSAGGSPGAGGYYSSAGGSGSGGYPGAGGYYSSAGGAPGYGGDIYPGVGGAIPWGVGGAPGTGCRQITSYEACEANPGCHSVFFDPGTCGCAGAGCCARFNHCADNFKASCYGQVICAVAPPHCESPYMASYAGGCYEGCVNRKDCAPVCSFGADQSCNDNPSVSSFRGRCTEEGLCECNAGSTLNPATGRCI